MGQAASPPPRQPPSIPAPARRLGTVGLAAAGVLAFHLPGLPLPFLFGPMIACLIAALLGAPLLGIEIVAIVARTVIGVAVGSSFTPEVLQRVPQMLASVAFVPLYVVAIGLVGVPFFHRICGLDRVTAYFSAMPGGLQDMVIFGTEAGGDTRALSLIHATRVLIILAIAPVILARLFGVSLDAPVGAPAADLPLGELGIMGLAAIVGWKGGERIGLFGATILGPMILTAGLTLAGVIEHRPPAEAILGAQFFIGIGIGVGYVGVTLREIRRFVLAGTVYVLILAVLAAAVTEAVVALDLARPVEGFLAFAPGGQAEMAVLAMVVGADLGFVVVHHVTRVLIVITGAPLAAKLLRMRK